MDRAHLGGQAGGAHELGLLGALHQLHVRRAAAALRRHAAGDRCARSLERVQGVLCAGDPARDRRRAVRGELSRPAHAAADQRAAGGHPPDRRRRPDGPRPGRPE